MPKKLRFIAATAILFVLLAGTLAWVTTQGRPSDRASINSSGSTAGAPEPTAGATVFYDQGGVVGTVQESTAATLFSRNGVSPEHRYLDVEVRDGRGEPFHLIAPYADGGPMVMFVNADRIVVSLALAGAPGTTDVYTLDRADRTVKHYAFADETLLAFASNLTFVAYRGNELTVNDGDLHELTRLRWREARLIPTARASLSPDGQSVAFAAVPRDGGTEAAIYVYDIAGNKLSKVADTGIPWGVRWVDGSHIGVNVDDRDDSANSGEKVFPVGS